MKRKLLTIILMVTLSITSLTACGQKDTEGVFSEDLIIENKYIGYFGKTTEIIVYDKNTKVKYLVIKEKYGLAITPLYNTDGTLQIHED